MPFPFTACFFFDMRKNYFFFSLLFLLKFYACLVENKVSKRKKIGGLSGRTKKGCQGDAGGARERENER